MPATFIYFRLRGTATTGRINMEVDDVTDSSSNFWQLVAPGTHPVTLFKPSTDTLRVKVRAQDFPIANANGTAAVEVSFDNNTWVPLTQWNPTILSSTHFDIASMVVTYVNGVNTFDGSLATIQSILTFTIPSLPVTFNDPAGNPIANGSVVISLNADAMSAVGQVNSQQTKIVLDANGVMNTAGIQLLSALSNNFASNNVPSYSVTVYNALGERVWGPGIPGNPALPSPLQ
jgi:hypothetical protein